MDFLQSCRQRCGQARVYTPAVQCEQWHRKAAGLLPKGLTKAARSSPCNANMMPVVAREAWLCSHLLLSPAHPPQFWYRDSIRTERERWPPRDFGRQVAFRAQSSCLPDFRMGLVASQVPYWPFSSGVFGVWLEARVGRTIPCMRPQHNFQQNLSSPCLNEGTGGSWGRSTRRAVRSPLPGEGPAEKLPSPAWVRAAPQARIRASHPVHEVWQSWGRGRMERGRNGNL